MSTNLGALQARLALSQMGAVRAILSAFFVVQQQVEFKARMIAGGPDLVLAILYVIALVGFQDPAPETPEFKDKPVEKNEKMN